MWTGSSTWLRQWRSNRTWWTRAWPALWWQMRSWWTLTSNRTWWMRARPALWRQRRSWWTLPSNRTWWTRARPALCWQWWSRKTSSPNGRWMWRPWRKTATLYRWRIRRHTMMFVWRRWCCASRCGDGTWSASRRRCGTFWRWTAT